MIDNARPNDDNDDDNHNDDKEGGNDNDYNFEKTKIDLAEMVDNARSNGISKNVDRCAESERKVFLGEFQDLAEGEL